ncbi:hypothetical protein OIU84_013640 [Salix udensis]|uniref:Uncharacterized protein n=1 Tax=Salix udensis TaxID=889485 RepID=A0AAD6NUM9_9ROSI|nr:hypothetical protein OIU84_013640 [Salix udensis]
MDLSQIGHTISVGNVPTATVKVEPITSMAYGSTFPQIPSVPRPSSQGVPSMQTSSPSTTTQDMATSGENAQDLSGLGSNPNTMSGSGAQMVQSGLGANPNTMSGLGASGVSSGLNTMIPTPGMSQQVQSGMQPLSANNTSAANLPLSQQTAGGLQPGQSKCVKVWEGNLSGQRQGQPVFIRLKGYRSASASETLAVNWPATMQIVRLISQDHMNRKQYVGKADFLGFRAMNQHGFLGQLQEKKLVSFLDAYKKSSLMLFNLIFS